MRPHFADAASSTGYRTTMTLSALRSYLGSKGIDTQAWWLGAQTSILQVRRPNRGFEHILHKPVWSAVRFFKLDSYVRRLLLPLPWVFGSGSMRW